ncbi:rhomboid family intramembrane serine protease [Wenyingzhuangia marina]|uniref:Membrane associated serine protease, rhomboid family n=1 Tax=Wenyingzhuangia marina TaxID=1195760 RepID=A0A1M5V521_9FLAO|nr:rhomboid family intramembrane serine protease [Wenyingzhuangia marina]GGF74381.1 rhomboid family intramembrane serine protease [Wenyingzhuangia marina]SHH70258.1 Membrane associated serine protease, rhomboid family [Wenyingzhuangia marina]
MSRVPDIIKDIIIINILFFVATISMQNIDLGAMFNLHYFDNPNFKPWQLVTSMFMHGSIGHIFFNMLALYFFGTPMVQVFGKNKFLFFYFSAGIGASLIYLLERHFEFTGAVDALINMGSSKQEIHELFSLTKSQLYSQLPNNNVGVLIAKSYGIYNMQMLGASGAIFGLLAGYAWYFPNSEIYLYFVLPVKAKYFIPVIVIADLISGLTGQPLLSPVNTAYFAHVGGAVIGLIMAYIWKKNQYRMY